VQWRARHLKDRFSHNKLGGKKKKMRHRKGEAKIRDVRKILFESRGARQEKDLLSLGKSSSGSVCAKKKILEK